MVAINSRINARSRCTVSPRTSAPARFQSSNAIGSRNTTPTSSRMAIDALSIFSTCSALITVATNDEAVAVANATEYGLAASVFTANTRRAIRAARDINAGTVTVNCYGEGDIATPFGGYKQSGFGGRDNGVHAHDQFTELKTIWIDLTDPTEGDNVG